MNGYFETRDYVVAHLRTANTVLPALVPQDSEAPLLRGDPLALLERLTNGTGRDLGVLVVPTRDE